MTFPDQSGLDALERGIANLQAQNSQMRDQLSDTKAELTRTKLVLQRVVRGTVPMACSDKEAWDMAEGIIAGEP